MSQHCTPEYGKCNHTGLATPNKPPQYRHRGGGVYVAWAGRFVGRGLPQLSFSDVRRVGLVHRQHGYGGGAFQGVDEGLDFVGLLAGASVGVVGDADDDGDGVACAGGVQDGGDVGAAVAALDVSGGQDQRAGRDADGEADAAVADIQGEQAAGLGQVVMGSMSSASAGCGVIFAGRAGCTWATVGRSRWLCRPS